MMEGILEHIQESGYRMFLGSGEEKILNSRCADDENQEQKKEQ
jgi:hypothetical protein